MSLTTVLSSSSTLGGKALLEKADRCFRLSQFDSAFKSCDDAVKSSDFTTSWKDKKRHEVIKTYIVYGRQSGKCAPSPSLEAFQGPLNYRPIIPSPCAGPKLS